MVWLALTVIVCRAFGSTSNVCGPRRYCRRCFRFRWRRRTRKRSYRPRRNHRCFPWAAVGRAEASFEPPGNVESPSPDEPQPAATIVTASAETRPMDPRRRCTIVIAIELWNSYKH